MLLLLYKYKEYTIEKKMEFSKTGQNEFGLFAIVLKGTICTNSWKIKLQIV